MHARQHAGRLAATFQGQQDSYQKVFQSESEANVMASDKSVVAACDYYGLNITVLFKDECAVWHYVPANQTATRPTHLLWLEALQFQRGPSTDLGVAARHSLQVEWLQFFGFSCLTLCYASDRTLSDVEKLSEDRKLSA
eukprot:1753013-Amphidinium_carterae.1